VLLGLQLQPLQLQPLQQRRVQVRTLAIPSPEVAAACWLWVSGELPQYSDSAHSNSQSLGIHTALLAAAHVAMSLFGGVVGRILHLSKAWKPLHGCCLLMHLLCRQFHAVVGLLTYVSKHIWYGQAMHCSCTMWAVPQSVIVYTCCCKIAELASMLLSLVPHLIKTLGQDRCGCTPLA
jgi:hypothetical protein